MIARLAILAGAVLGAVSVAAGAFGAHGLKAFLEAAGQSANWETAFRYSLVHAVALLATGCIGALPQAAACRGSLTAAVVCFILGTLIFSGCLAALCLTGVKILGAIVPIGGTLLIAGWILLAIAALRLTP
ncbi:MAG: hypothetical protein RLZZ21_1683 [Planctomycetota bacterium]|jgi:uncharacterized membrane protein YgdD (TMEM256/DUF423 family)